MDLDYLKNLVSQARMPEERMSIAPQEQLDRITSGEAFDDLDQEDLEVESMPESETEPQLIPSAPATKAPNVMDNVNQLQSQLNDAIRKRDERVDKAYEQDRKDTQIRNIASALGQMFSAGMGRVAGVPGQFQQAKMEALPQRVPVESKLGDREIQALQQQLQMLRGQVPIGRVQRVGTSLVQIGADGQPVEIFRDTLAEKRLGLSEKAEGRKSVAQEFRMSEKQEEDARSALKDMRQTDLWKNSKKTLAELPIIDKLLDDAYERGGQSLAMLGPKVAKGIAGEVGVLTEQDIKVYTQNPKLRDSLLDSLAKVKDGKITKVSYDNLKRLISTAKQTAEFNVNKAIDAEATIFARREGLDYETARYYIDENFKKEADKSRMKYIQENKERVRVELPDGRKATIDGKKLSDFVKKYPNAKILE